MWRRGGRTTALLLALATGCSPAGDTDRAADRRQPPPAATAATTIAPSPPPAPAGLVGAYTCRGGFTCGRLEVPEDRARPDGPTLLLQVAVETDPAAPRGVLVFLNGGPGAAAAPLAPELAERLGPDVLAAYRLVVLDPRGTGPTALRCPALQTAAGDTFRPTAAAVRACAAGLGARRASYGTDDVVADLDDLRRALEVPAWSLFGVSYGTFVAQQYAVAHPRRTSALVLDSALPATGIDVLRVDVMRATRRVLRLACRGARRCAGDPVADLAAVVRRDGGGADLLELLAGMSSARPDYGSLLPALRQAARGHRGGLDRLLDAYRSGFAATPEVFSAGLHVSAFCADQAFPWGRSDEPVRSRAAAVRRAVSGYSPADLYPFDRAAAAGNSAVRQCRAWPAVRPSAVALSSARARLPGVPTLLVLGDRDLSAPLESVVDGQVARGRKARVEVVRGAGHVVTARPGRGRALVRDFLLR